MYCLGREIGFIEGGRHWFLCQYLGYYTSIMLFLVAPEHVCGYFRPLFRDSTVVILGV